MIANLDAVFTADAVAIAQGNLSNHAYSVLFEAGTNLSGYSGNKLSADAATFSQDEESYMPGGNQTQIDTSFATPMLKDIVKLTADCPKAYHLSKGLSG